MRKANTTPIYSKVAYDIASKIASGQLAVGERFSGRSLMSSQYAVSPETIRRALRLLADMGIIRVRENIGSEIISKSRAVEYVERCEIGHDLLSLRQEMAQLMAQRDQINGRIAQVVQEIVDLSDRFRRSDALRTYEFAVHPGSPIEGRSIRELEFRQRTGATIVAVRHEGEVQLSPSPHTLLQAGDSLVVACGVGDVEQVAEFMQTVHAQKVPQGCE